MKRITLNYRFGLCAYCYRHVIHGEYDLTIGARRRCGLVSNYFDHLCSYSNYSARLRHSSDAEVRPIISQIHSVHAATADLGRVRPRTAPYLAESSCRHGAPRHRRTDCPRTGDRISTVNVLSSF